MIVLSSKTFKNLFEYLQVGSFSFNYSTNIQTSNYDFYVNHEKLLEKKYGQYFIDEITSEFLSKHVFNNFYEGSVTGEGEIYLLNNQLYYDYEQELEIINDVNTNEDFILELFETFIKSNKIKYNCRIEIENIYEKNYPNFSIEFITEFGEKFDDSKLQIFKPIVVEISKSLLKEHESEYITSRINLIYENNEFDIDSVWLCFDQKQYKETGLIVYES